MNWYSTAAGDTADDREDDEHPELLERITPREQGARRGCEAGFTDVLSIGMLMRWMSVSTRPIETPAKPAENFQWKIAAIVTVRNAVITISATITAARL